MFKLFGESFLKSLIAFYMQSQIGKMIFGIGKVTAIEGNTVVSEIKIAADIYKVTVEKIG
jgi:hypothetical protein